ncbi:MAG: DNA polymerase III subunit gamma/tau [Lachnospiraceae bacterium]|nr:DNA polymerase III subunit gamma/tau [Lachnospiraceae bacterium]
MSYMALYRKFRPERFEDVKGQEHIVTTLQNQLQSDRIAHAYLFCGTRGTGKTTIAKIFAKAVNCENPKDGNPCGECPTCKAIASGASMNVFEIDAASNNGVDNIREIIDEVSFSPAAGKYKVYIIDEVHMLSAGAFNALLKTLEEPPSYVIFILATTEVHKIPVTILSRCQRYDFKRITIETITDRLRELTDKEQVSVEDKALRYVAKAADGSMRDALSLLDQCIAFHYGKTLTYDDVLDVLGAVDTSVFSNLLRLIVKHDIIGCIEALEEMIMQGRELGQVVSDLTWYLRNLLLVKTASASEDTIDMSSDNLENLKEETEMVETDAILRYIRIFSELSDKIRYASQKRILLEMTLIKACKPEMESKDDSILDRIRNLEDAVKNGAAIAPLASVSSTEAPKKPVARAPLPKAVPDDIRLIMDHWESVIRNADGAMKVYLKNVVPTLVGDRFSLAIESGVASDYFTKNDEHKELLERLISDEIQKEVEFTFEVADTQQQLEENYPDLRAIIGVPVEVVDE